MHAAETPVPATPTIETMRGLARPGDDKRDARVWDIRAWNARPNTWLALSQRSASDGAKLADLDVELAVLEHSTGAPQRIAVAGLSFPNARCDERDGSSPSGPAPSIRLDLAPYQIAEGETAIGVRVSCEYSFPAGEGSETRLFLFQLRAPGLGPIFDAAMTWSEVQRGPGSEETGSALLIVDPTQHEAHFDLKLKESSSSAALFDDAAPKKKRTTTRRFIWSAGYYAERKQ